MLMMMGCRRERWVPVLDCALGWVEHLSRWRIKFGRDGPAAEAQATPKSGSLRQESASPRGLPMYSRTLAPALSKRLLHQPVTEGRGQCRVARRQPIE